MRRKAAAGRFAFRHLLLVCILHAAVCRAPFHPRWGTEQGDSDESARPGGIPSAPQGGDPGGPAEQHATISSHGASSARQVTSAASTVGCNVNQRMCADREYALTEHTIFRARPSARMDSSATARIGNAVRSSGPELGLDLAPGQERRRTSASNVVAQLRWKGMFNLGAQKGLDMACAI